MTIDQESASAFRLGYARTGTGSPGLEAQIDALTDAGIEPARIYTDKTEAPETVERPGWTALLDYARPGDTTVIIGLDRLGRTTPEVLASARELTRRRIGLRSLREGLDTADPTGSTIVGVLASLAELDDEAAATRPGTGGGRVDSAVGRPRALDDTQVAAAERMRVAGLRVPEIAARLGVSRATVYRSLAGRRAQR
ncbi:recombinase family protein [Gordonia sp. (in: high G+C Gram-positive bacteria)]|uniref:recombinase family protein n=1 Tax=Gordonia sp. (in: high G+C Gram-positive bacteria) TaxID=84139 RepID=UPI003527AD3F